MIFNDFYSGDLGPGTIVGSAAFNLFIIIGICSYSLGTEVKRIDSMEVFIVTAIFAVGAYVIPSLPNSIFLHDYTFLRFASVGVFCSSSIHKIGTSGSS